MVTQASPRYASINKKVYRYIDMIDNRLVVLLSKPICDNIWLLATSRRIKYQPMCASETDRATSVYLTTTRTTTTRLDSSFEKHAHTAEPPPVPAKTIVLPNSLYCQALLSLWGE